MNMSTMFTINLPIKTHPLYKDEGQERTPYEALASTFACESNFRFVYNMYTSAVSGAFERFNMFPANLIHNGESYFFYPIGRNEFTGVLRFNCYRANNGELFDAYRGVKLPENSLLGREVYTEWEKSIKKDKHLKAPICVFEYLDFIEQVKGITTLLINLAESVHRRKVGSYECFTFIYEPLDKLSEEKSGLGLVNGISTLEAYFFLKVFLTKYALWGTGNVSVVNRDVDILDPSSGEYTFDNLFYLCASKRLSAITALNGKEFVR